MCGWASAGLLSGSWCKCRVSMDSCLDLSLSLFDTHAQSSKELLQLLVGCCTAWPVAPPPNLLLLTYIGKDSSSGSSLCHDLRAERTIYHKYPRKLLLENFRVLPGWRFQVSNEFQPNIRLPITIFRPHIILKPAWTTSNWPLDSNFCVHSWRNTFVSAPGSFFINLQPHTLSNKHAYII